jgi:hypothetical protein
MQSMFRLILASIIIFVCTSSCVEQNPSNKGPAFHRDRDRYDRPYSHQQRYHRDGR